MLVRPVDHDKLVAIDRSGETVTDLMDTASCASGACRVANHSCVSCVNFHFEQNTKGDLFTSTK